MGVFAPTHAAKTRTPSDPSPPASGYAGERCMLHVFDSVIAPAAERFRPDLILVSAGFDAHYRDPFQGLQLRRVELAFCAADLWVLWWAFAVPPRCLRGAAAHAQVGR